MPPRDPRIPGGNSGLFLTDRPYTISVLALGWTTIITQTVLLRSFLSVFHGNELVVGVVLASWLILTGTGAALRRHARSISLPLLVALQIALALLPLATVLLMSFLRNLAFPPGTMIGLAESMYGSLILLAPICIVSGYLFPVYAAALAGDKRPGRVALVYGLEGAGSVIGGLLFTLLAVQMLTTMQTLTLLGVVNLGVTSLLVWHHRRKSLSFVPDALILALIFLPSFVDLDALSKQWLFAGQELVEYRDTPYGNITVTRQGEQLSFFENSGLLFSTGDAASNEESVHFAMAQRGAAKRVLLISGGISGMIEEIKKYPSAQVEYVEINPWLIEMGNRLVPSAPDPRVRVIEADARRYVREAVRGGVGKAGMLGEPVTSGGEMEKSGGDLGRIGGGYDVVLINVPDPGTAQINRYYTREFFRELRSALSPEAVVSLSVLPTTEYLGHEARELSSIIYATLASEFKNVVLAPGMKNHFLASDGALRTDIARLVDSLGISTTYVNAYYLDDRSTAERSRSMMSGLDRAAAINHDFTPAAYYRQVQYWLSYFSFEPWLPAALCLLLLAVMIARMRVVSFCMFIGGAAGSSLEVVLLLAFQIVYGSLYLATGLIITAFMGGLAVGSLMRWRFLHERPGRSFVAVQVSVGLYALLLPVFLGILRSSLSGDVLTYGVFLALTAGIGSLIGMEFSLASRLMQASASSVAGRLYSIDLVGSAAGALVVSVFVLPLLGIVWVCVLMGCLSLGGALLAAFTQKRSATVREVPVQA